MDSIQKEEIAREIQNHFEAQNGKEFSNGLKRFNYLYKHFIPKKYYSDDLLIWFVADTNGFNWQSNFKLNTTTDTQNKDIYEFESDFTVTGYICFEINNLPPEKRINALFSLTLRVFKYPNISEIHSDHIEFWTQELKVINEYNKMIKAQYKGLGLESIIKTPKTNYSSFIKTWPKISNGNKKQVHTSSRDYYYEIVDVYEQLMYLITNVNTYKKYTSNYLGKERNESFGTIYDINLSLYDRRYLDFCSYAFEKLYEFWERLAFLIYQFIPPTILKIKQISFYKIISELKKDINNSNFIYLCTSENFKWLSDFESHIHKALREYRHPLIHYQIENPLFKGGFYSGTITFWKNNISNRESIKKLQKANENHAKFIIKQFESCKEGLERTIGLIKEIP